MSPWRENRVGVCAAVLVVLGLWFLVFRLLPADRVAATLLGVSLLGSLAPGMAPMRCRLDEEGAARRVLFAWNRRRWTDIRRARLGGRGLFVSPLARPGRLDRYRGLFLPLPASLGGSEALRDALRGALERHGF